MLRGAPPKVIILAIGNRSNDTVLSLLLNNRATVDTFIANEEESLLILRAAA